MVSIAALLILTIISTFINLLIWWVTYKNNTTNEKNKFNIIVLEKAMKKLNIGFKDHERRLDNIENLLLSKETEEPEEPEESENTCKDCKYYDPLPRTKYFSCERFLQIFPNDQDETCVAFEKKESLDDD